MNAQESIRLTGRAIDHMFAYAFTYYRRAGYGRFQSIRMAMTVIGL
jgi:hypothetical protein